MTSQHELDERAARLLDHPDLQTAAQRASKAYLVGARRFVDDVGDANMAMLPGAMQELVFSLLQKAINDDPRHPHLYQLLEPPRRSHGSDLWVPGGRYTWDNPDNVYRTVPVDGESRLRIHGRLAGPAPIDVNFRLMSNPNTHDLVAQLDGPELEIGADGMFTVTIDPEPAAGRSNHIQTTPDARQLFIRNTLGDWSTELPHALALEVHDAAPDAPERSDEQIVAGALGLLDHALEHYASGLYLAGSPPNVIQDPPPPGARPGTLATQSQTISWYQIARDEALVVRLELGGAAYAIVPVTNLWNVSAEHVVRTSSLNTFQAEPDPDGAFTFVLSLDDPGVWNWLDPVGLDQGTLFLRWQVITEVSSPPRVSSRVVPMEDLGAALPDGDHRVTPSDRATQQASRAAAHARRYEDRL